MRVLHGTTSWHLRRRAQGDLGVWWVRALRLGSMALLIFPLKPAGAATDLSPEVGEVSLSRPFFNPAVGQSTTISFRLSRAGQITVLVLDLTGHPVRRLADRKTSSAGQQSYTWDGRDGQLVVPNGAFCFEILLRSGQTEHRFPEPSRVDALSLEARYDTGRGVITYRLPSPSLVRVAASTPTGIEPALKRTIVDWKPRAGGSVVEEWDGLDDTGRRTLVGLGTPKITVEARALPTGCVITVGNPGRTVNPEAGSRDSAVPKGVER